MRTLSTDAAAAAIGVSRKMLDNVIAREARPLIGAGRRGRSRRIPADVLERIAIALILNRDLGVGIAAGIALAKRILSAPNTPVSAGALTALSFDTKRFHDALERSIEEALESVAERTRGRPKH
jgi:uncharacterized protein YehS (DUF1456 family)